MANGRRDVGRERFWREAMVKFAGSGLSIRAFFRRAMAQELRIPAGAA